MTTNSIPTTPLPNRREFLYYLAGGALLLGVGGGVAAISSFLQVRLREGIEYYTLDIDAIESMTDSPITIYDDQRRRWAHLVSLDTGLKAFRAACPFELSYSAAKVSVGWDGPEHRYKCPACGSQFRLGGEYIVGPARRNMDQYVLMAQTARGSIETPPDGAPLPLEGVRTLTVDLRRVIYGAGRGS
jgi:hypothetical protein